MKDYIKTNIKSTFDIASEVATGLHFSIANIGCLYGIFTLGIIKLIPGTEKIATPAQQAIGRFAYMIGRKED
jgi:hypothetical protein